MEFPESMDQYQKSVFDMCARFYGGDPWPIIHFKEMKTSCECPTCTCATPSYEYLIDLDKWRGNPAYSSGFSYISALVIAALRGDRHLYTSRKYSIHDTYRNPSEEPWHTDTTPDGRVVIEATINF